MGVFRFKMLPCNSIFGLCHHLYKGFSAKAKTANLTFIHLEYIYSFKCFTIGQFPRDSSVLNSDSHIMHRSLHKLDEIFCPNPNPNPDPNPNPNPNPNPDPNPNPNPNP